MASGLLLVWATGSVIGPLIAGALYASPLGMRGVFLFSAISGGLLALSMVWRKRQKAAPSEADREDFVNLHATSAQLAEIDPDEAGA